MTGRVFPPKKVRLGQLDDPTLAALSILSRDGLSGMLHDVGESSSRAGASTWQHSPYSSASAS